MNKQFLIGLLVGTLVMGCLALIVIDNGWESEIKTAVNDAEKAVGNAVPDVVPGHEALGKYIFPDDPSIDAPWITAGPAKGDKLVAYADATQNPRSMRQRAYMYQLGNGNIGVYVLKAFAGITLDLTWEKWIFKPGVTGMVWQDETHLVITSTAEGICIVVVTDPLAQVTCSK